MQTQVLGPIQALPITCNPMLLGTALQVLLSNAYKQPLPAAKYFLRLNCEPTDSSQLATSPQPYIGSREFVI